METTGWTKTGFARHRLCAGYDHPSLATAFGHLLALADGIIDSYRGDLYHDALWMDKHLQDGGEFYWAPRMTGTAIGTDMDLVAQATGTAHPIYRCRVYVTSRDVWYLDVETLRQHA